ncbi:hypothetical protein C8J32_12010 [Rhizobium sp. PP-CC-3A-592]|nr:hypothetical protein C8J32_12010 [Rhizobium sp. PP-CC-3A-592]
MRRRTLLSGSASCLLMTKFGFAQNFEEGTKVVSPIPPLPSDLMSMESMPAAAYEETENVGTAKPSKSEIDDAYDVLYGSPYDGAEPIDIALYFVAVGAGAFGDSFRQYAREWPVRANPMIFHFFSSTQTQPAGDQTAWCAAFMNWCLLRSKSSVKEMIGKSPGSFSKDGVAFPSENLKRYSTNSASSGSFRCWNEISVPERGNIAVFKDSGTDTMTSSCRGTGHVAFFQS